jgi:hypothetical protein
MWWASVDLVRQSFGASERDHSVHQPAPTHEWYCRRAFPRSADADCTRFGSEIRDGHFATNVRGIENFKFSPFAEYLESARVSAHHSFIYICDL